MSIKAKLAASMAQNQQTHSQAKVAEREDERSALVNIPLAKVSPNPFQPRTIFSEEAVAELAETIKSEGLLQPVLVRPNGARGYELISGERRLRAFQRLGLEEIPAVVRSMSDTESATSSLQENIKRENLTDLEVSFSVMQIKALLEAELGEELGVLSLSERLGVSRPALYRYLSFQSLPPKALEALRADPTLMSGTTSYDLKRWVDSEAKEGRTYDRLDDVLCVCISELKAERLMQSSVMRWVQEALIEPEEEEAASDLNIGAQRLPLGPKPTDRSRERSTGQIRTPTDAAQTGQVAPVKWVEGRRVVKVSLSRAQLTDAQLERIKSFIDELVAEG